MSTSLLFNITATTEIYTLSLHDALPILEIIESWKKHTSNKANRISNRRGAFWAAGYFDTYARNSQHEQAIVRYIENNPVRSEEHTSELQSQFHLVCRLLLEKKKKITHTLTPPNESISLKTVHLAIQPIACLHTIFRIILLLLLLMNLPSRDHA